MKEDEEKDVEAAVEVRKGSESGRAFANEGGSGFPLSREEDEVFFCFDRAVTAATTAAASVVVTHLLRFRNDVTPFLLIFWMKSS